MGYGFEGNEFLKGHSVSNNIFPSFGSVLYEQRSAVNRLNEKMTNSENLKFVFSMSLEM